MVLVSILQYLIINVDIFVKVSCFSSGAGLVVVLVGLLQYLIINVDIFVKVSYFSNVVGLVVVLGC